LTIFLPIDNFTVFVIVLFVYRGHGKDGSMGSLHGKFSLIDLAGTLHIVIRYQK